MGSLKARLPQFLRTDRLVLELFDYSAAHYNCLLNAMNSPAAHSRMGDFGIRTPEQFDAMNRGSRLHSKTIHGLDSDIDVYYILRLGEETGPLIGGVSLMQRAVSTPPDLGWALLEEYHGKGYASEAARELLRFAREDMRVEEVIAWPGVTNQQSQRVAQKAGLVRGGEIKDQEGNLTVLYMLPGMKFDEHMVLSMWGDQGEQPRVEGSHQI